MRTFGMIVAAAVGAALALSGCGHDDDHDSSASSSAMAPMASTEAISATAEPGKRACTAEDITVSGGFGTPPTITIADTCAPPKTLITKDLVKGAGPEAKSGQQLAMNYTLITWSDKKKLDSSFDRGEPFELTLGAGQVIPGWDQGLAGIKQGGRRLLIVPPDLGYGQGGMGIKPNETLVFVTDAVKVPAS
ncbi:MAG: FKBP-type peptidyl-prolyl cis-trans isomerase [Mycobacteriaceae bacterium]|nr:FKBP-type peptidyl-prolyl cis-trans isomerase [Mycobacteriaceae bacterium]